MYSRNFTSPGPQGPLALAALLLLGTCLVACSGEAQASGAEATPSAASGPAVGTRPTSLVASGPDRPTAVDAPQARKIPLASDDVPLTDQEAQAQGVDTFQGTQGNPILRTPQGAGRAPNNRQTFAPKKDMDAKLTIEFGLEKHEFGPVRQGDILNHTFELESVGKNPVEIRQASPTCGCTVSELLVDTGGGEFEAYKLGDPIQPGTKVRIEARLDTTNKQNKTQVRINVYTNDPIGLTQLALVADIEPFIKATPAFVNFGDIKEGESRTQVIDIRTSRGEPVQLETDPRSPIQLPTGMQVELEPVNPGEDGRSAHWRAKITIGEGAQEGQIGYQLRLVTDIEMPQAKVTQFGVGTRYTVNSTINGRVLGALSFTPQFLSMGLVRPGQLVLRTVKVISHDPDFDLSDLTVELQGDNGKQLPWAESFSTSVKPAPGMSNAVDVQLRLDGLPEGADGSFRGVMIIHTGHERKPEIRVRFSGVCRAGVTKPRATPTRKGGG
ncbi:MAG: DUF1573 domain-containing protein [Planctomycetota bacterium]